MADLHAEMLAGLQAAARGDFQPRFYRVKVSRRREKRYRRPGMASWLSPAEARAVQAFRYFGGLSISAIARRFHRHRQTIAKALSDPVFSAMAVE
jgi:hypothetical protein